MDNLDMKILSRLLNNCRESDRSIGKEIGISGGAVRTRIQKMINKGVIEKFILKIEPPVFSLGVLYFVVSGQDIRKIIKQVSLVGEPFFVVTCVGGITVCSVVVREDLEKKIELAKNLMKDIRILSIFEAESTALNSRLTKTDLEIMDELIKNPRQKIESLSRTTELSTKTITRCIEKLQNNDGIQFTLVYNPMKIEYFITHAILAWVERDIKVTLDEMEKKFSESYLQIPFITKNQIVLFMYSENIFQMDDLTQRVREIKNVKSTDLFIPKKISFPTEWLEDAIKNSLKIPRLHLTYTTN